MARPACLRSSGKPGCDRVWVALQESEGGSASLVLEHIPDPALIGVHPDTGEVPVAMGLCVQALSAIAPRPAQARLVVSGDFVRSVRDRLPPEVAGGYGVRRGSGFVAAKTMPNEDGTVDVLVPSVSFLTYPDETPEQATLAVLRTVVHEAGHVAMAQRGEVFRPPDDAGWRAGNLLALASEVLAEYRADRGVPATLRKHDAPWNGLEIAKALRADLSRVNASYQQHLDVVVLAQQVGNVTSMAWKTMAFMVAAEAVLPGHPAVEVSTALDPLWQRVAGPHFPALRTALRTAAAGDQPMSPGPLTRSVVAVAEVLGDWLDDLGLVFGTTDDGQDVFLIAKWDLLDPALAAESTTDVA